MFGQAIRKLNVWTVVRLPAILRAGGAMTLIRERRIDGVFEGYRGGRVHRLADGSRWRQEDATSEHVYRERPAAKLLRDGTGRTFLAVEGTSGVVWVVPYGVEVPSHVGAFYTSYGRRCGVRIPLDGARNGLNLENACGRKSCVASVASFWLEASDR
jgi:hypothetical protein